jgi:hypothetical protein
MCQVISDRVALPAAYFFIAWYVIKHRDKFTFYAASFALRNAVEEYISRQFQEIQQYKHFERSFRPVDLIY